MIKLLYITFIDLDNAPTSGSSVRPLKMLEAFRELDVELVTVSGANNRIPVRRQSISRLREKLKTWTPDICYIEPPSGLMFYRGDLAMIRWLHRAGVPISLFYRDAYWRYPDYYLSKDAPLPAKLKQRVIRLLQKHQWRVFNKNIDILYFPSLTMAREFGHTDTLPPGAFIPSAFSARPLSRPLQCIFVGGAAKNHGTFLTLDAFKALNAKDVRAKLFYICPEDQWAALGIDAKPYGAWLEVVHTSGDDRLRQYYERSDIALLTAPRTFYRDFAVPIKIYEYISYLKPMLVTNCTETARIVMDNGAGWVVEDNVDSVVRQLADICNHPEQIEAIRAGMPAVRQNNLWTVRAEKVVDDLAKRLRSKT